MNEKLLRLNWQKLSETERRNILKNIGERYEMCLQKYVIFSCYGQETPTAVYTCKEAEFVFVPGDNVTLGYDGINTEMDLLSRGALYEDMSYNDEEIERLHKQIEEKYRYPSDKEELADYAKKMEEFGALEILKEKMKNSFTPVRQAEIGPMLVERRTNEVDAEAVYAHMEEEAEDFDEREILIQQIDEEGFSLPTKDEWEYLCGGGCRTLFPWGEGFFEKFFGDEDDIYDLDDDENNKKQPNFFGIFIAEDSYEIEVVQDGGFKGGDGGCASCGGFDGLDSLNYSPYINNEWEDDDILEGVFVRRIIRITE